MSSLMRSSQGKRSAFAGFLSSLVLATLVACDGTPLPAELQSTGGSGSAPSSTANAPLNVNVTGFVGGSAGSTGTAGQASRATVAGATTPGANGVALKDLGWNNLFTEGLSTSLFPAGLPVELRFYAEGETQPLVTITNINDGNFNQAFDARQLRRGSRLQLELSIAGASTRVDLPQLNLRDGDRLGFNAVRRADGSLIAEVFLDAFNNTTQERSPDGVADNGIRIVIDNGTDVNGDGQNDTVARMDTADGMSFFDLNLDGRFGDPANDGIRFIDSTGDGFADVAFSIASESEREGATTEELVSFLYDPELDGRREADASRDLGDLTEGDLVAEAVVSVTPGSLPANGINTATVRVELLSSAAGIPVDAQLRFSLARTGGELLNENYRGRFLSNDSNSISRLVTPADPTVRLLFDGTIVLSESFIVPLLQTSSVTKDTRLDVSVSTESTTSGALAMPQVLPVALTPSDAPILSDVSFFGGQNSIAGVQGGLEALTRHTRLVWGDRIRITGENFATEAEDNSVTIGGVEAPVELVSGTTQLEVLIPEGAVDGPVTVVVGGLGGKTTQNLVVAGTRFEPVQILPASTEVPTNAEFSVKMSRPIDASSLTNNPLRLVHTDTSTDMGWSVSLAGDDTLRLVIGSGTAMSDAETYQLVLNSDLIAADASPTLRYDANPAATQVNGAPLESFAIQSFTAQAPDVTPPTLLTSVPANGALDVNAHAPIVLTFSEAITGASVSSALSAGTLTLVNQDTSNAVDMSFTLNTGGDQLSLQPMRSLAGKTNYLLTLPAQLSDNLTDRAGLALDAGLDPTVMISFFTAMTIEEVSPRSGPVGAEVRLVGGKFGVDPSAVSITLGGVAVTEILGVLDEEISFRVPANATDGNVQLTIGSDSATSPVPFTITLDLESVVIAEEGAGGLPNGLAISVDDTRAFVAYQRRGSIGVYDLNRLVKVDADGNSQNGVSEIVVGGLPSEARFSRDNRSLLTLDFGTYNQIGNSFFVVNAEDSIGEPADEHYALSTTVPTGRRPTRIATSPDGARWYVTNFLDDSITVVSAEPPYQVVATIPTGFGPNGLTISADGSRGYVANYIEGTVTVFDTASNESIGNVIVGLAPARVALSPDGAFCIVSCHGDSTLHVIDTATNTNVYSRSALGQPASMVFSRDGSRLFVANRNRDVITMYDFVSNPQEAMLTEVEGGANIATGRVPSTVRLTNDGSRLVVTNEADSNVSVIFLEKPVHSVLDLQDESGGSIRSGDSGTSVSIKGQGLPRDTTRIRVLFTAKPSTATTGIVTTNDEDFLVGEILVDESTPDNLVVRIPGGAISGPLVVEVDGIRSSPIDWVITPDKPKVERTTPSDQAIDVPTDTAIVVRFSEPVRATDNDFLLQRRLDTFTNGVRDLDPTSIPGTISFRDFNREVVFTPLQPLSEVAGSNNMYQFTIQNTITDVFNKNLERATVVRFRLADQKGPTLLRARYVDINNNGVDANDFINLEFDEDLVVPATSFPANLGVGGLNVGLNAATQLGETTTFGTGARLTAASSAIFESSSALAQVGRLARTMTLRLGTDPALLVPGTAIDNPVRNAVNAISNLSANPFTDLSGNSDLSIDNGVVDLGFILSTLPAPQALSIRLTDQNGNGILEEGEEAGIYMNNAVTFLQSLDISAFSVSGGGDFGAGATVTPYDGNGRVVVITGGTGASIDFNNTAHRISATRTLTEIVNFVNVPFPQWNGADIPHQIGEPAGAPRIDFANPNAVLFNDLDSNGPDAGDVIQVRFDATVTVAEAAADVVFTLAVAGDSFGRNARVRSSIDESLSVDVRSRTVEIVLGANPVILPRGTFAPGTTTLGSASGLDVNPNLPRWTVADAFGTSVRNDAVNGPFDVGSSDVTPPQMVRAVLVDSDSNGSVNAGDLIRMVFNESALRNGVTPSDFTIRQGVQTFTAGPNATIARGPNASINGVLIDRSTLDLVLATGTNVPLLTGLLIEVNAGNPIGDVSGNTLLSGDSRFVQLPIPETTVLQRAVLVDVDADGGASMGDSLYAVFSTNVSLSTSSVDAWTVFDLPFSGDDFGSGASVTQPAVNQEMIDAGVTTMALGMNDPRVLKVTLGSGAVLGNVSGSFAGGFTRSHTGQSAMFNANASFLTMAYPYALGFGGINLANAFTNSAATGNLTRFDDIGFDADGDSVADYTFSFTLPNNRTSLDENNPTDIGRIVGAMNEAFRNAGSRLRAVYNGPFNELVVFDNGSGELVFGGVGGNQGSFLAGGDVSQRTYGYLDGVSMGEISNALGLTPLGSADVEPAPDNRAPELMEARYSSINNTITLTFSEALQIVSGAPANAAFGLPVTDDSFGQGAEILPGSMPNEVVIQLGTGAVITDVGEFSSTLLTAGSPSGIAMRLAPTVFVIRDLAGNPAVNGAGGAIDIQEGEGTTEVTLTIEQMAPSLVTLNGTPVVAAAFSIGVEDVEIGTAVTSVTVQFNGLSSFWLHVMSASLYEDLDMDGQVSASDSFLTSAPVVDFSNAFNFPLDLVWELETPVPTGRYLVVLEIAPNANSALGQATIGVNFSSLSAEPFGGNMIPVEVVGVPASAGSMQFEANTELNDAQISARTIGAPKTFMGIERASFGMAATSTLFDNTSFTITENALMEFSDVAGEITNVGIDWNNDTFSDVVINTSSGLFSGTIDTAAERQAFAAALRSAFSVQFGENARFVRVEVGPGNGISVVDLDRDFFFNGEVTIATDDSGQGSSSLTKILRLPVSDSTSAFGNFDDDKQFVVMFGGIDSIGTLHNDVIVFSGEDLGSTEILEDITVSGDPAVAANGGFPEPRQGMAFVMSHTGDFIMHGGSGETQILNDTWLLKPVFRSNEFGQRELRALRWKRVSTSGPDRAFAVAELRGPGFGTSSRNLVVIGGRSNTGVESTVHRFNPRDLSWTSVSLTGDALNGRWLAMGGYDHATDSFMVYGGAADTGVTSDVSNVQLLRQSANGTDFTVTTATQLGQGWPGTISAASMMAGDAGLMIVSGGANVAGDIVNGVGLMMILGNSTVAWTRSSGASESIGVQGRIGAKLFETEDAVMLAFGESSMGYEGNVLDIWLQPASGETFEDHEGPMLAVQMPVTSDSHGVGDQLMVVFSWSTNLRQLFPSGTLNDTQLESILALAEISEGLFFHEWGIGTTATLQSTNLPDDTLLITFGESISILDTNGVFLTAGMHQSMPEEAVLRALYGGVMRGAIPVLGTSDASRSYIWTGAVSSNFFTAANWNVMGAVASNAPGIDDVAIIPTNATRVCMLSSGAGEFIEASTLPGGAFPHELNQLIVAGGSFVSNRDINLIQTENVSISTSYEPAFAQAGGMVLMPEANDPTLRLVTTLFEEPNAFFFGHNQLHNVELGTTGPELSPFAFMAGHMQISGNLSGGEIRQYLPPEDGAGEFGDPLDYLARIVFNGTSVVNPNYFGLIIDSILVDKSVGGEVQLDNVFTSVALCDVIQGTLSVIEASLEVHEEMFVIGDGMSPGVITSDSLSFVTLRDGAEYINRGGIASFANLDLLGTNAVLDGEFQNSSNWVLTGGASSATFGGIEDSACIEVFGSAGMTQSTIQSQEFFLEQDREYMLTTWYTQSEFAEGNIEVSLVSQGGNNIHRSTFVALEDAIAKDRDDLAPLGYLPLRLQFSTYGDIPTWEALSVLIKVNMAGFATVSLDKVALVPVTSLEGPISVSEELMIEDTHAHLGLAAQDVAGVSVSGLTLLDGSVSLEGTQNSPMSLGDSVIPEGAWLEAHDISLIFGGSHSGVVMLNDCFVAIDPSANGLLQLNEGAAFSASYSSLVNFGIQVNGGSLSVLGTDFTGVPGVSSVSNSNSFLVSSRISMTDWENNAIRILPGVSFVEIPAGSGTASVEVPSSASGGTAVFEMYQYRTTGTGVLGESDEIDSISDLIHWNSLNVVNVAADVSVASPYIQPNTTQAVIGDFELTSLNEGNEEDLAGLRVFVGSNNADPISLLSEISNLSVYLEDGTTAGFQSTEDTQLATLTAISTDNTLSFTNAVDLMVSGNPYFFYITADISEFIQPGTVLHTVVLEPVFTGSSPVHVNLLRGQAFSGMGVGDDVAFVAGDRFIGTPDDIIVNRIAPAFNQFGPVFSFQPLEIRGVNLPLNADYELEVINPMGGTISGFFIGEYMVVSEDGRRITGIQVGDLFNLPFSSPTLDVRLTIDQSGSGGGVVSFDLVGQLQRDFQGGGGGSNPLQAFYPDGGVRFATATESLYLAPQVTGGTPPYTFSFLSPTPNGISFDSMTGAFYGRFDAQSNTSVDVSISDSNSETVLLVVDFIVDPFFGSSMDVTTRTFLEAPDPIFAGQLTHFHVGVIGGTTAYTWGLNFGPSFVTVDSMTGLVSAVPTALDVGFHSASIQITSGLDNAAFVWEFNVLPEPGPLTIGNITLTDANVGTDYEAALWGVGGAFVTNPNNVIWTLDSTTLAGVWSLSSDGILSGTPEASQANTSQSLTVTASDGMGATDTVTLDIFIAPGFSAQRNPQRLVAFGDSHTVYVDYFGSVKAVGSNGDGQVGDGTNNSTATPVTLSAISLPTVQVDCGDFFSAALTSDGTVYTWGDNGSGQLGDGTTTARNSPDTVDLPLPAVAIACGESHMLAILSDSTVWAWGSNSNGQLGVNDQLMYAVPRQVALLRNIVDIAAGVDFSVALDAQGQVWYFGFNNMGGDSGSLGQFTTGGGFPSDTNFLIPIKVPDVPVPVVQVSASWSTLLMLGSNGYVYSYGTSRLGLRGVRESIAGEVTRVQNLSNVVQVAAGYESNAAIKSDGTMWAWGDPSDNNTGFGFEGPMYQVREVDFASGVRTAVAVAGGWRNIMLIDDMGQLWGMGEDNSGELGQGSSQTSRAPLIVPMAPNYGSLNLNFKVTTTTLPNGIANASYNSSMSTSGGNGGNEYSIVGLPTGLSASMSTGAISGTLGQYTFGTYTLGLTAIDFDGTIAWKTMPMSVAPQSVIPFTQGQVMDGEFHALAVSNNGSVFAWGENFLNQVGDGTSNAAFAPVQVLTSQGVTEVAVGELHSMALDANGGLWVWGDNTAGQLGNGTTSGHSTPFNPTNSEVAFVRIATSTSASFAIDDQGNLWAWGSNINGQLGFGLGQTSGTSTPSPVSGIHSVVDVKCHDNSVVALRADGTVFTWGEATAALGFTSVNDVTTPTPVASGVVQIATGSSHTLALTQSGQVFAWGDSTFGQVGTGSTSSVSTPTQLSGFSNVVFVGSGPNNSCAADVLGNLYVWGYGAGGAGNFGMGNSTDLLTPVLQTTLTQGTVDFATFGHTNIYALRSDGTVSTAGADDVGQLGDGSGNSASTSPVSVSGLNLYGSSTPVFISTTALAGSNVVTSGSPITSTTFAAVDGTPSYAWDCLSDLPDGLSLSSAGVLSGTPTRKGFYVLKIRVMDSTGRFNVRDFPLLVQ